MDVDSSIISSLLIIVDQEPSGSEILAPSITGVLLDSVVNSTGRFITFTGDQPLATYEDILREIQYTNTEDEPMPGSAHFLVQVVTPGDTAGSTLASNTAAITVEIVPVNDHDPAFSQSSYSGEVEENSASGTVTGVTVMAVDGDVFGSTSITYEIAGGSSEFTVGTVSGVVSTAQPLDAEANQTYQFVIIARDNDGDSPRSSSASITIAVRDLNDNSPVFDRLQYSASVGESAAVGQAVLTVSASDEDVTPINSAVRYELLAVEGESGVGSGALAPISPTDAPFPFAVDSVSGEISVTEALDFETITEYTFQVVASDTGSPSQSSSAEVTVYVLNANDVAPEFLNTPYNVTVREDTVVGSTLLTVIAQDQDSDSVSYSIDGVDQLAINSTTGVVTLAFPLDHEAATSLVALVVASDAGSPPLSSAASLHVEVSNVNDNPPQLSQDAYMFTVIEGMPLLGSVIASDVDGDQISYLLQSSDGVFTLDMATGLLSTVPGFQFDFEQQQMYSLQVLASDGIFNDSATVIIQVNDTNDLAPSFEQPSYTATVPETSPPGASIVQVAASDGDSGSNAEIEYRITSGPEAVFSIDRQTGLISLRQSVNFETDPTIYTLVVEAANSVPPFWNDTATVTVIVSDSNDAHPVLLLATLSYLYLENSPPLPIAAGVVVTDADTDAHPLTRCVVQLERGPCGLNDGELNEACGTDDMCLSRCSEEVAVNESLVPPELVLSSAQTPASQTLTLSGDSSEAVYEAILSSLTFFSSAVEPTLGTRNVSLQCWDRELASNLLDLSVEVVLLNEFCPVVTLTQRSVGYTEGSGQLGVGEAAGLSLSDPDRYPHDTAVGVLVSLGGASDRALETLTITDSQGLLVMAAGLGSGDGVEGAPLLVGDVVLEVTGEAGLATYTAVLQSLVYVNAAPEPTPGPRSITILPLDTAADCVTATLTIEITVINDNAPELILDATDTLRYQEESGALFFSREVGLRVEDPDHNSLFPMQSASVTLQGVRDVGREGLAFEQSSLPGTVAVNVTTGGRGRGSACLLSA